MCGVGEEVYMYELRTLLCILQKGHVYKASFRDGKALSGSYIQCEAKSQMEYNFANRLWCHWGKTNATLSWWLYRNKIVIHNGSEIRMEN